jgi:hypothetical protein
MIWECWLWGNPDHGTFYNAGDEVAAPLRMVKEDPNHNHGELWWIERAYEHIAMISPCLRCGAELGRRLRAIGASGTSEGEFGYVIETRCGGWRRHRLVAVVSIDSGDLVLGRFLTRGSAPLSIHDAIYSPRNGDT